MRIGVRLLATCLGTLWAIAPALAVPSGPFQLFVDPTLSSPTAPFFNTIAGALAHVGADTDGATNYHILVYPGVYNEAVVIETPHVTLEGVSRDRVRLALASPGAFQIQLAASSLTVRNLTFAGALQYNMQVLLSPDRDHILIENCRFMGSPRGVYFVPTTSEGTFNENIQFRNNVVEATDVGVQVGTSEEGEIKGNIDFLSRDNRVVIRHTGSGPFGYSITGLAPASRFRSLSDSLDIQAENGGSGTGDVNGYVFLDWMPDVSEIVGAEIRLTYINRGNATQSFAGVKIHGPECQTPPPKNEECEPGDFKMPASGERAVVVSAGTAIHIVDRTTGVSGSGGHGYQNAAARVDIFVSGGTVTYDVDDPANFTRSTFSLVGQARESAYDDGSPNGIFYAGIPVDQIIVGNESGVDGVVQPYDQGAIKATKGLVGASTTIQIDDLADAEALPLSTF